MALTQSMSDFIARVNLATNKLAERIRDLKQAVTDAVAAGGATKEQEAEFQTELDSIATGLEAMGADPNNPLPTPPPTPPPTPTPTPMPEPEPTPPAPPIV